MNRRALEVYPSRVHRLSLSFKYVKDTAGSELFFFLWSSVGEILRPRGQRYCQVLPRNVFCLQYITHKIIPTRASPIAATIVAQRKAEEKLFGYIRLVLLECRCSFHVTRVVVLVQQEYSCLRKRSKICSL